MRHIHARRRVVAAMCTLAVLFAALAGGSVHAAPGTTPETKPAANEPIRPIEDREPATQYTDPCNFINLDSVLNGHQNSTSNGSQSRSGVSAVVDPANGSAFSICSNPANDAGPIAWVGIIPRDECCGIDDPNAGGMYLGITECIHYTPPVGFCDGNGNASIIAAVNSGCGAGPSTVITDIYGSVGDGPYTLTIYLDTDQIWHFKVDGTQVFTKPNGYFCWTSGLRAAFWGGEKWDDGDSLGNSSTVGNSTRMTDAAYGVYGSGWFTANFCASTCPPCLRDTVYDICNVASDDEVWFWTP